MNTSTSSSSSPNPVSITVVLILIATSAALYYLNYRSPITGGIYYHFSSDRQLNKNS